MLLVYAACQIQLAGRCCRLVSSRLVRWLAFRLAEVAIGAQNILWGAARRARVGGGGDNTRTVAANSNYKAMNLSLIHI